MRRSPPQSVAAGVVLFAVPRRDVADQLGRRLQSALAGVETVTLRGGTPHAYDDARVVVSTVHQTIRFCERFDLIIVDEVDAFPLNCEVWLLGVVGSAAKRPGGRFVLMTATPPKRLLQRIGKGGLHCLTLPGRPHGRPLPVPEIVLEPSLEGEGTQTRIAQRQAAQVAGLPRRSRPGEPPAGQAGVALCPVGPADEDACRVVAWGRPAIGCIARRVRPARPARCGGRGGRRRRARLGQRDHRRWRERRSQRSLPTVRIRPDTRWRRCTPGTGKGRKKWRLSKPDASISSSVRASSNGASPCLCWMWSSSPPIGSGCLMQPLWCRWQGGSEGVLRTPRAASSFSPSRPHQR